MSTAPAPSGTHSYSRENPSDRYKELIALYKQMHVEGETHLNIPPEQTFPGRSLGQQAPRIKEVINATGARTILDYGSGKAQQYKSLRITGENGQVWNNVTEFWDVEDITLYDPCYEPYSTLPTGTYDGVVCTDVLEHCPEEDIDWILEEMFGYANIFVYANICCFPARKHLPNGENAHCTIKPLEWWVQKIKAVAARYPAIRFDIWVQEEQVTNAAGETRKIERCITNRR